MISAQTSILLGLELRFGHELQPYRIRVMVELGTFSAPKGWVRVRVLGYAVWE